MSHEQLAGRVVAVSLSERKGVAKKNVEEVLLIPDHGVEGDAHAGPGHRQVSLLAVESIAKMAQKGLQVGPGSFAENITTEGVELTALRVGDRLRVGEAVLQITQLGKECHTRCAIFRQVGECVMPKEGVFARVVEGGRVRAGDGVKLME